MTQIQSLASSHVYMVSSGNHEYDFPNQKFHPDWSNFGDDSGGECGM
jgi:hypothetical protein